MDGNRFDDLARTFAARRSRRTILKSLGGSAAGGLLGVFGARRAGAADQATLCHKPGTPAQQSLTVATSAVPGHLGHGDYLNAGGCCATGVAVCIDGAGNGTCCPAPSRCLADGTCCTPTTCAAQGKNCGTISDGCGLELDCGACTAPESCGGGGVANVCGCTPTTCAAQGATCGSIADACGGALDCGVCDPAACLVCADDHTCISTCPTPRACVAGACKLPDGGGCADDAECHSGICAAGTCQTTGSGEGGPCDADSDCANGPCVGGICCASGNACGENCCTGGDQICSTIDGACCTPDCANSSCGGGDGCGGTCQSGNCPVCYSCSGAICLQIDVDPRCDGTCIDGECQAACLPIESACTSAEQCCQDVAPTFCEPAGLFGLATGCCRHIGQSCADAGITDHRFQSACCNLPPADMLVEPICDPEDAVCCIGSPGYCSSFDQCCRSTGAVACQEMPPAYPFRSPLGGYCCKPAGAECSNNAIECCDGYCGVDGRCTATCLPNGADCQGVSHACCSYACNGLSGECEDF